MTERLTREAIQRYDRRTTPCSCSRPVCQTKRADKAAIAAVLDAAVVLKEATENYAAVCEAGGTVVERGVAFIQLQKAQANLLDLIDVEAPR